MVVEPMKRLLKALRKQERGQDLVEYSLLVAFVAMSCTALYLGHGHYMGQVWSSANVILNQAASSTTPPTGPPGGDHGHGHGDD